MAPEKVERPATTLVFLGIELDSHTMTARLPADKLQHLKVMVSTWQDKKVCTKRELLSLVGVLQHETMVIRYGRVFLRRMIKLAQMATEYHHFVRLNCHFRSDLQWWRLALPCWNGIGFLTPAYTSNPEVAIYSDATGSSGSWGLGAWCQPSYRWFQGSWPVTWISINITAKELLPIAPAAAIWGPQWSCCAVCFYCDNAAIVHTITSGKSSEPLVM